ncbi:MAG: hypothetical protein K0A98_00850 [Trueperaceae bacterium]|nr:hypothetical protein [Trueperaceae bacterium]
MATIATPVSFAERIKWDQRIKPALIALAVGGIGYLIGAFYVAPRTAAELPNHLPPAFAALPTGSLVLTLEDAGTVLLPVRIADTSTTRDLGFRLVGEQASANTFLLYTLTREVTTRTSYSVDGLRAPVEYAAIDASGQVVSITEAPVGATRVSIADRHQWLLAAQSGTLERFGVTVGAMIDPALITKF